MKIMFDANVVLLNKLKVGELVLSFIEEYVDWNW